MTEPDAPTPAEHPPGEHVHFPEVAWPESSDAPPHSPRPAYRRRVTDHGYYGSVPVARVAQPKPAEPPPMADERFADPLEPESHVAAYILLLLTMLALVAVVARAEGWL